MQKVCRHYRGDQFLQNKEVNSTFRDEFNSSVVDFTIYYLLLGIAMFITSYIQVRILKLHPDYSMFLDCLLGDFGRTYRLCTASKLLEVDFTPRNCMV